AATALPAKGFEAEDNLWKLWARYVTGGAPYRPSFAAMFLDPMFVQVEVVPADLPVGGYVGYNPLAMPLAGPNTPLPPPPTTAPQGFGNAPPIIVPETPPDAPWIPSTQLRSGIRTLMPGNAPVFNVLIANDQTDWPQEARDAVQAAVKEGKGFVILHNALGDNQNWPWWYQEVLGGHLALADHDGVKKGTVTPSTTLDVRPVGNHPIVQDIGPLRLTGETAYKGMWQSPKITPLLETTSGNSDRVVAWIGPNPSAKVVCIQPGASSETHRNPAFRKLVRNAILWAGGRLS
ncbi:MAG: ThuA domain-containing protein, partial [Candidatus Korobacteraceae bacterium]